MRVGAEGASPPVELALSERERQRPAVGVTLGGSEEPPNEDQLGSADALGAADGAAGPWTMSFHCSS